MTIRKHQKSFIAVNIIPTLLLYGIFFIYPFIKTFYISLFSWKGLSKHMRFIGFENFKDLVKDPIIWKALENNLFFLVWGTIIIFGFSIFFATVMARKRYGEMGFYRIVFFFPNILSIIVVGLIWKFIYNPSFGLLNAFLESVGLESWIKVWLGDVNTVMPSLVVPQAWMYIGFYMLLLFAAMQNIPESYYESAKLDGAGEITLLFRITIPLIWETMRTAFVFFVINAFSKTFNLVYVVTRGGPSRSSELLTTYLYQNAFEFSNYGYATSIGVFLFVILFVISIIVLKFTKAETYEY
jgi:N-acetylglucosamine transport system permease protein